MDRLTSLNAHYIREADDSRLVGLILPLLEARGDCVLDESGKARLVTAMPGLKPRAKTLKELADNAAFYVRRRPLPIDPKAAKQLTPEARTRLGRLAKALDGETGWMASALEDAVRRFAEAEGAKLGDVAQPLRAALTGSTASPPIFDVMETLGRNETLARMGDIA
jgi:glutamyl-tRNA synthetase